MGILLLLCGAAGAPSWQAECHVADSMKLKRTYKRISETFIIHEGRLVIVDHEVSVSPTLRHILADFQSSVIMFLPFIMNESGLLLCRHMETPPVTRGTAAAESEP